MDPALKRAMMRRMPPINQTITDGLAVYELKKVKPYINALLKSIQNSFPEGLVYEDMVFLTPVEEYLKTINAYGGKTQYDIARSDMTMVMLVFSWRGERIEKVLYLPYARDGGMICIKGASFSISPVLADKGISYSSEGAFIEISKAKINIKRIRHHILSNGQRKTPNIAYSWLYRGKRSQNQQQDRTLSKMVTIIVHYLFAKYGVHETFRRFNGSEVVVGDDEHIHSKNYDPEHWVICQSIAQRPKYYFGRHYTTSTLRVAIRSVDYDEISESMIAGIFYLVDHAPQRILPHYIDGSDNELRLWRVLLGLIIGSVSGGEGCVKEAVDEHMDSLDSYIDTSTKTMLEEGDIYVNTLYELLYHVLENISQMMLQPTEAIASLYDKKLSVLMRALSDVANGINKCSFALKNMALKKELTYKDVDTILRNNLPIKAALKMNNPGQHPEVCSVSSPNDNKFFKITSNMVLQNDSNKKNKGNRQINEDKTKFVHVSLAEIGSYIALTKSEPTGRGKINPWVLIDSNGTVLRNVELQPITERTQELLRRS